MSKNQWHVLINRQTCSSGWKKWNSFLDLHTISYQNHHTSSLEELHVVLSSLYAGGARHFLFAGGDGTIHHCGNTLMQLAGIDSNEITIGVLPCGTGNDWVRTFSSEKEVLGKNIFEENTTPLHLIRLTWPSGKTRYAFNMVGGAIDAAVVYNLKRDSFKIPSFILYPFGLLKTLMKPHEWSGTVSSDQQSYTGNLLTIQAGFGKYCGGGMHMIPHAEKDSPGLLIMKPKKLLHLLIRLHTIYNGKITKHKEALVSHFKEVEITHTDIPIPIESDGEFLGTSPVKLTAIYGAMKRIV
jgi:diacylglycerol kinase (ATP)